MELDYEVDDEGEVITSTLSPCPFCGARLNTITSISQIYCEEEGCDYVEKY